MVPAMRKRTAEVRSAQYDHPRRIATECPCAATEPRRIAPIIRLHWRFHRVLHWCWHRDGHVFNRRRLALREIDLVLELPDARGEDLNFRLRQGIDTGRSRNSRRGDRTRDVLHDLVDARSLGRREVAYVEYPLRVGPRVHVGARELASHTRTQEQPPRPVGACAPINRGSTTPRISDCSAQWQTVPGACKTSRVMAFAVWRCRCTVYSKLMLLPSTMVKVAVPTGDRWLILS